MATASFVTDLTEILTQAVEAAAGIAGIYNGFKILEISEDYYKLYKEQRDFYYGTFQAGLEAPLASEVYTDPKPILDYAGRISTAYNTDTGPFGGRAGDAQAWWERHANAYGAIRDTRLQAEYQFDVLRVKSDWSNYLFRFEETYFDLRNDIRWRKRMGLHNIGIKQGTAVASAMDSALTAYQGHLQDFGNQLATYGNGIAASVGYKKGLADTADDFNSPRYDTSAAAPTYNHLPLGPSNGRAWNFGGAT